MRTNRLTLFTLVALFAVTAAACGKKKAPALAPTAAAPEAEAPPSAAPPPARGPASVAPTAKIIGVDRPKNTAVMPRNHTAA